MKLRGIDFGSIFLASGTLNFFGQGWPYHRLFKLLFPGLFDFRGATFISKTTTLGPRLGNLSLGFDLEPTEWFPRCIRVYPWSGMVLNSVGLSGPGANFLLRENRWQKLKEPFLISFMPTGAISRTRLEETKIFIDLLATHLPEFQAPIGLQLNLSCPNTGHNTTELVTEALLLLEIAARLGRPLDLKINALVKVELVKEIADSKLCDVITCSNTIPWGELTEEIDWVRLFGSTQSPLVDFGGGGLSGRPLLPIVTDRIRRFRDAGIAIKLKAGGGILEKGDVLKMKQAGADAVEIGSVAILRPWRVGPIIRLANQILGENHE